MVDTTPFLVVNSRALNTPTELDLSEASIIPDGNSGTRNQELTSEGKAEGNGKYDEAGANVFRFMRELNHALFFILTENNINKRDDHFFEQLEQSFVILQAGILTGKIWRKGIHIELEVKRKLFQSDAQKKLLKTVEETIELNNKLLGESDIEHKKTVTLSFGSEVDAHNKSRNRLVIRTGMETESDAIPPETKHRFSTMLETEESFVSISTGALFSSMDNDAATKLLERRRGAQIHKEVCPHTTSEAINLAKKLTQGNLVTEAGGADISIDVVCENPSEAIEAIRKVVNTEALSVIGKDQEHDPINPSIRVIELPESRVFDFSQYQRVILGGQANCDYAVIPAGKMGEVRFYQAGGAEGAADTILKLLPHLHDTANLGGGSRIIDTTDSPNRNNLLKLLKSTNQKFKKISAKLADKGIHLTPSDVDDTQNESQVAEEFIFGNKISAKRLLNYLCISTWVSQAEGISTAEEEQIDQLILTIWHLDHLFDNEVLTDDEKMQLKAALTNNTPIPERLARSKTTTMINEQLSTLKETPVIWEKLKKLIEIMANERGEKHENIKEYLQYNHPSVGASVVLKAADNDNELNENDCMHIDEYARILNDINTGENEGKTNALDFETKDELLQRVNDLERDYLNPLLLRIQNTKLKRALHRFTTMGKAIYLSKDGFTGSTIQLLKEYVISFKHESKDPHHI